jgi:hypothetical protein
VLETERQRIARELHDDIGQVLSTAKLMLQMVRDASHPTAMMSSIDANDAESARLDGVKTPPPVFTLSKPFSEAALQEILSQGLVAWSDAPRP